MASSPAIISLKGFKPKFLYSEEAMKNAMHAVDTKNMSCHKASVKFGVPRSTLENKVKGKTPRERKMGPSSVLTAEEEDTLVKWILSIAKAGFPLIKEDLLCTVQKIIQMSNRETPFTNNKPGRKWFKLFLARHPEISVRVPETLTQSRAKVTEVGLRMWFKEMEDYFCKENLKDVLKDPQRIYNCDEAAFLLCPKTGKVLAPRGCKDVYEIVQGSDKESLTVLMTVRADGVVCPPFIVYPYVRLPSELVNNSPKSWGLGKSKSGWMNGETFYEFIANIFFPWLQQNQVDLPIILFMDGHKSHLTLHLSKFCAENGIILIALPPNSTHIMQPCDVSLFKVMKLKWKQLVHEWRVSNSHKAVTKITFAKMFEGVVRSISSECISNGFRRCGLYPFNPDAVDYSKCDKLTEEANMFDSTSKIAKNTYLQSLKDLEHFIDESLLNKFNECFSASYEWNGDEHATELYNVWQKMKYNTVSDNLVTNISYSTASNPATSDVFNTNASCISNLICSDDHNLTASSIPDSTAPTNASSHTAYNASNCTTSVSNLAASNISVEASNLECPASSLISDTFEADLEVPRPSQIQLNATDVSKNENFVVASNSSDIINTTVSSPFKRALFWPEPIQKKKKTRAPKEKIPSVATSSEWQKYYQKKENEKTENERQKEERKQKRLVKKEQLLNKNSKKIKNGQKKKKCRNINSKDSESDADIIYDDSTDSDNIKLGSLTDSDKDIKKGINLFKERYYAVFYDEQYHIGRIIDLTSAESTVKFLRETKENEYIWPLKSDIATIENRFIFYGPLELSGNVPFSLEATIIRKIKTAYRQMKQRLFLY